jgi:hypothetical protein
MDWYEGLKLVTADIKSKGRELKSVVQTSRSMGEGYVASDVLKISANLKLDRLYNKLIRDLFALGVPLVVAAGNEADPVPPEKGALLIDTFPSILKTPDLPIINVGASSRDRGRVPFSQYGPLLDVYALGYRIKAMTKVTKVDNIISGTSFGKSTWTQYRCNMF